MLSRIPLLIAMVVIASCASPEKDWELATRDDSPETYLEFLARHPNTEQADQARARIEELKVIRAWERTEFRASPEAYARFIRKYPESEYVTEAEKRITAFGRDREWERVSEVQTTGSLSRFISTYPDAPQREEAEALLAELQPIEKAAKPKERPGAFRLQLAAFRTPTAADQELRRLVAMFPTELLGPVHIETPAEKGNGNLFLLKTVPMSGDEAREVCALLKDRGQQCMIINK